MNNRALLELRITMIVNNVNKIKMELDKDRVSEDEIERRLDLIEMDIKSMRKALV